MHIKSVIRCYNCRSELHIEEEYMTEWDNTINYSVAFCDECEESHYKENFERLLNHLEKIAKALDVEYMDGDFPIEEVLKKIQKEIK